MEKRSIRMQASVVVDEVTERAVEEARDTAKFRGAPVDKDTSFVIKEIEVPSDKINVLNTESPGMVKKPVIVFRWTA